VDYHIGTLQVLQVLPNLRLRDPNAIQSSGNYKQNRRLTAVLVGVLVEILDGISEGLSFDFDFNLSNTELPSSVQFGMVRFNSEWSVIPQESNQNQNLARSLRTTGLFGIGSSSRLMKNNSRTLLVEHSLDQTT